MGRAVASQRERGSFHNIYIYLDTNVPGDSHTRSMWERNKTPPMASRNCSPRDGSCQKVPEKWPTSRENRPTNVITMPLAKPPVLKVNG